MFTAVSPGKGSEHTQCPSWSVWGQGWRKQGAAPASVSPAPALHMSGCLLVILEARGGNMKEFS